MASFSNSFIGSASSASASVRDAIESYRRAQYLAAGSAVTAASDTSIFDDDDDDEEGIPSRYRDVEEADQDLERTPTISSIRDGSFVDQLEWDEEYDASSVTYSPPLQAREHLVGSLLHHTRRPGAASPPPIRISGTSRPIISPPSQHAALAGTPTVAKEDTPLLHKKNSVTFGQTPTYLSTNGSNGASHQFLSADGIPSHTGLSVLEGPSLSRRQSAASLRSIRHHFGGKSTFGQTLFNSIAILLGIGMLSEPLAFHYAGWVTGTFLIVSYGFISCYTAKILARVILNDPRVRSYSDIGRKAFGPRATPIISAMFCLELFAVSVILVTLYGDSLHSLHPQHTANTYKVWGLIVLIPAVLLPLSVLSYASIIGIVSTVMMIAVLLIDGFSKTEAPGSLWDPAETSLGIQSPTKLGLAFGLFMAGFSGHAVIPSLARDMQDPRRFDTMINWAFVVATFIYTLIGAAGYLMFGGDVSDEFSADLMRTPGYNPLLNRICLWMLVLNPLSKFGLATQPLNATLEILFGIDTPIHSPEEMVQKPDGLDVAPAGTHCDWKRAMTIVQRVTLTTLAVVISIAVPEFSSLMAFLGSFSAFMISIVGPIVAGCAIHKQLTVLDVVAASAGFGMAIWGTWSSVVSS